MATSIVVRADPSLLLAQNPSTLPINIKATYDGRLLASISEELEAKNYAYTLTYTNTGVLSQEFRTFEGQTDVKTYTYDPDGNLTGESPWIPQ